MGLNQFYLYLPKFSSYSYDCGTTVFFSSTSEFVITSDMQVTPKQTKKVAQFAPNTKPPHKLAEIMNYLCHISAVSNKKKEEYKDIVLINQNDRKPEPYFQEIRDPPTGKGMEADGVSAATWQWYELPDAGLQEQHNINPPLVVKWS